jgi:predicted nucleic acid-binding protein
MRKYSDQAISFTDCVSFVLMRREGIKRAFSFDKHFRYAGFTLFGGREPA